MTIFGLPWLLAPLALLVLARFFVRGRESAYLAAVTATSLSVLTYLQPWATVALLLLVLAVHQTARSFRNGGSRSERVVTIGILALVAAMAVGKYGPELFRALFPGNSFVERHLLPPLGLSYLCFRLIHYLLEAYRGTLAEPTLPRLLAFAFFLPTFPAGPIETFNAFHQKRLGTPVAADFAEGLWRITLGYFKKTVVLGILFGQFLDPRLNGPLDSHGIANSTFAFTFMVNTFLHAYFDLSAYSDLAIGFSRLLGFRIAENFQYPFAATNLGAFWNRWHMTLSAWCRNNVYFPVFGWTRKPMLGLYASMAAMGLWHRVSGPWLAWGLWHASGLTVVMHWGRYKRKHPRIDRFMASRAGALVGWALTMAFVSVGYAFVALHDLGDATRLIGHGLKGLFASNP